MNGALRAANLRLLLEHAPVREALSLVAEVPLERLEAMSRGALCPDETAFHIERALKLPGKWLDGLNKAPPARTLELLRDPGKAALHDDDLDEEAPVAPAVVAAAAASPSAQPVAGRAAAVPAGSAPTKVLALPGNDSAQQGRATEVASATPVEHQQANDVPVARGTRPMAAGEGAESASRPAARAAQAAAAPKAGQPPSSTAQQRTPSDPKATSASMPTPELRQQNLGLLVQGKGAKSALARLIGISQPYMSTIANGGKVLDQAFCRNVAKSLGLHEDWFEAPRTVADIPAAALKLLLPVSRSTAASASTAATSGAAAAEGTPAGASGAVAPETAVAPADSSHTATAVADDAAAAAAAASQTVATSVAARQADKRPHIRPASSGDHPQRTGPGRPVTASARPPAAVPVQADLLAPVEPEVQPAAQAATPAPPVDVPAVPAVVPVPTPVMVPASESVHQVVQRMINFTAVSAQPLVIDGGLAPITEALIKILALKDRQGRLSEDKAFELLGTVRLL
ncbi:helix-turn-helix domain-containing protein [Azohydromonas aeria]|uniref:helix-turn-helix domain-containing protein n=1 Tax=Azohydromonas aeria TaxID=2590212 RepID=UPI0012FA86B4|nr:helix-turn-helix transcriptional regulator [Azohydromonas aeria]